jgi:hypothetical protein
MYVPLGLYMHPMGLVCPLGAHLCPLGLNYARWGSIMPLGTLLCPLGVKCVPRLKRARPSLCVHTLASSKPLEAHICPLGAQLCPPGGQVRAPPMRARPPQGVHALLRRSCPP